MPEPAILTLIPIKQNHYYSKPALDQADGLFEWIKDAPEPVLRLIEAAGLTTLPAERAVHDWCTLARSHALDLFHDAGMEALAWPQAVLEGLYTLSSLFDQYGYWKAGSELRLETKGMRLDFAAWNETEEAGGGIEIPSGAQARVLTLDDVARELVGRTPLQAMVDTEILCDALPSAPLPAVALAVGTFTALSIVGRLTGFERMSLGGAELGWVAHLLWSDAAEGDGPTGEVITDLPD